MRWCGIGKRKGGGPKPRYMIGDFAEAVGVDVTTARRWFRGGVEPDRKHLQRIHKMQTRTGADRQVELFKDRAIFGAACDSSVQPEKPDCSH
jgi:hypothetical protein